MAAREGGEGRVRYLCGCPILIDGVEFQRDPEGFVVCTTHGMRRAGWRMPSHSPRLPAGLAGATDLEYEQFCLFGKKPEREPISAKATVQDRRDNSDPEVLGNSIMQMGSRPSNYPANGNGNGKWLESVPIRDPDAGRKLMAYHRELAQRTEARRVVDGKITGSRIPK